MQTLLTSTRLSSHPVNSDNNRSSLLRGITLFTAGVLVPRKALVPGGYSCPEGTRARRVFVPYSFFFEERILTLAFSISGFGGCGLSRSIPVGHSCPERYKADHTPFTQKTDFVKSVIQTGNTVAISRQLV